MQNAVAFANNDVVTIAWSYGTRPDGCMGFAIHRIDNTGAETPLPSHAVFPGNTIKAGQTTDDFPIQKFYWKDVYARLVAEKTGNRTFRYKVIPVEGTPGHISPMTNLPTIITNEVTVSAQASPGIAAYFNRGLISTQRVSRAFQGHPGAKSLVTRVSDETDKLRGSLSGDMVEALTGFVARAKSSGTIYAALYEMQDRQLVDALKALGNRLHIVLSNAMKDEVGADGKKHKVDGNTPYRDELAATTKNKWDRLLSSGHIGHNKFLVYADAHGKPQAVLLGSTNWTPTGLCTQTNNTLIIDDPKLATRYLAYWRKLRDDTKAAGSDAKALQATPLRSWDAIGKDFTVGTTAVQSWFSPNTPKPRATKTAGEKRPVDMEAVAQHILGANQAVLFLAFYPGSPCIANWAAQAQKGKKELFVRGCVTNVSAAEGFYYELRGQTPPAKIKGAKNPPPKQDPRVFAADAFDGKVIPEGWMKEILNAGFAIIHDKVVVIDPFSDNCVVVTGSHNLGHKASYDNDENLVIVQGNKELAVAYATHVLDVYDHFSWRWNVKTYGNKGATEKLKKTPDEWLSRYFDAQGQVKVAQLKFWMSAAV